MSNEKASSQQQKGMDPTVFRAVEPIKMFDDLYYIGNKVVGIYVLKTSEGLVFIDATENVNAYEEIVKSSLEKLGFADEKVIAIFLTHGHFDHYLGADSIRVNTGCEVGLSMEDTAYMAWCDENVDPQSKEFKSRNIPRITFIIEDGKDYTYGEHTIHAMIAPGHTPGCLCFSFDVHENGVKHRVALMGGYGVFGPDRYEGGADYPYSRQYAVDNALKFASSCMRFWTYAQETNCDIYLNPHPHLCDLFKHAEMNKIRSEGDENAYVIGLDGVRKWILERFDVCLESASYFAELSKPVK